VEIAEYVIWILAGFLPTLAGLSVISKLFAGAERREYRVGKVEVTV
jgi:hypothetical protein